MKYLILMLAACLLTSAAIAQEPDPITSEMNRHNEAMARLRAQERFTSNNPVAGVDITSLPSTSDAPAAVVYQSAPVVTASTCNCALTGRCNCDPATCVCAACRNGQLRVSRTYPEGVPVRTYAVQQVPFSAIVRYSDSSAAVVSGSITATTYVDRKGRVRQYIEHPRGMSHRTARAVAAGVQ